MKQKMTIHRALCELKLIDSKIQNQINELVPVGIYQKGRLVNGVFKEDEFKTFAQSKFDSVTDLIQRKSKIKTAIVHANSNTTLKVGEKTMTIADAINFKSLINWKRTLMDRLKSQHNGTMANLNNNNNIVEGNIQKILEATFGKENVKVGKEDVDAVRKPYLEANEWHLFNPINVSEKIESINKEVSDFEMEIDAALSEINAITFIEI